MGTAWGSKAKQFCPSPAVLEMALSPRRLCGGARRHTSSPWVPPAHRELLWVPSLPPAASWTLL